MTSLTPTDFDVVVKPIERTHLKALFAIMDKEGWDLECHELEFFYENYGQHMYGAFNGQDQLLGHIFARILSTSSVLVELVIARRDARGKGIGKALMNFVVSQFDQYNICVVPLIEKEGFYAKFGFCKTEFEILKFVRPIGCIPESFQDGSIDVKLVTGDKDTEDILSYKRNVHEMESELYLQSLCKSPSTISLYAVKDNCVKGFLIIKQLQSLVRVSSFYADDIAMAKTLLYACSKETTPGLKFKVACPVSNRINFRGLFEELWGEGFDDIPVETLMTNKGEFTESVDWKKIYGVLEGTFMMFA